MPEHADTERGDAPDLITMLRGQIVEQDREVARLRLALQEIFEASRDDGLAAMCNWMRGRAAAALAHIDGRVDAD